MGFAIDLWQNPWDTLIRPRHAVLHLLHLFALLINHEDLVGGGGFEDAELEGWEAGALGVGGAREEAEGGGGAGAVGGEGTAEEKDCCEQNSRGKEQQRICFVSIVTMLADQNKDTRTHQSEEDV